MNHRVLVAAILDCLRAPEPGEDFIDLTVGKKSKRRMGPPDECGRARVGMTPHRPAVTTNKAGLQCANTASPKPQQSAER